MAELRPRIPYKAFLQDKPGGGGVVQKNPSYGLSGAKFDLFQSVLLPNFASTRPEAPRGRQLKIHHLPAKNLSLPQVSPH